MSSGLSWRLTIRIIAGVSCLLPIGWIIYQPGFEPILALLGGAAAFIGSFVGDNSSEKQRARIDKKVRASSDVLVWNSSEPMGTGLPESSLPVITLYIARPDLESDLRDSLLNYTITCLSGPSGIGKTYIASKVLSSLRSSGVFNRIIYFESQPELSTLISLLSESCSQANFKAALEYLDKSNTIIVFDNFKTLSFGYDQFLKQLLTYTTYLRVVVISQPGSPRFSWIIQVELTKSP